MRMGRLSVLLRCAVKDSAMKSATRRDFVKTVALVPLALGDLPGAAEPTEARTTLAQAGRGAAVERFDYVVAGAGHNSLICAGYLAKAGNRVLVLEGRAMIGGGAKTAEVLLPGFKEDLCSSSHALIVSNPLLR